MPGPLIPIGGVGIDVIPNAQGLYGRLAPQVLPDANRIGEQAGREMGRRLQSGIADGIRDGMRTGGRTATAQATRDGSQAGGAFGRAMRTRLEAALRSLPDIRIDANTSQADADIQALRVRLESLRNQRIGIDIDAGRARAEAAEIEEQLRRLGAAHPNVQMRVDTAAARAALVEFRAELDRLSATAVSVRVDVEGGFAQRVRAAVEAAQAQLPDITVGANTSQASAELQALRGQLEALRTVRVGIDIDAATALARINEVQARLAAVAASNATADVRVDAAAAAATLAAVQAQVNALDGDTARIDVDVSSALAGLVQLRTLAASVGPALVPAFAAAAYGVGAFTSVLAAATVGAGVFAAAAAPGLIEVGKAVQATTAANDALAAAQDKTMRGGAAQAVAAQQQALAMAGAQESLANAQRNSAQQVADAQDRVRDAVRGVADAQEQAAARMDQALDRVNDAERQRTAALKDERRAELDLLDAHKARAQQLEDLQARVAGGRLDERSAVISLEKAQKDLDDVKKSGAAADSLQVREAQLNYDQALQRLEDQRRENKRLADESKSANKGVQQAEDNLAQARERSAAAAKGVADAQAAAARTQVENAKAVAKAREQVGEAERAVARAQQQGAQQVASALRQVESAQLAAAAAAVSSTEALSAANTALDKQKRLLEGLTPAQRGVYDAVLRLKDGFKAWSAELSPDVMGLFTRALDGITNTLPGLTPLVLAAADGFERLADRGKRAFEDPFWDRFKINLVQNIPRAIESMGVVFGNVFAGIAGIINAFLPQTDAIADSMEGATASFREWGQGLETSAGFRSFREFLAEDWPGVRETFADLGAALWQITKALAAISPSAVLILQGVATAIENTPVWVLQSLIDLFFAYRVAVFAVAAATKIYAAGLALYTLGTAGATAGTWSLTAALRALSTANIVLLLLTLAGTFVLLMIQSEDFRAKVVGVFQEIGQWGVWLWENALKPTFDAIMLGLKILGAVVFTLLVAPYVIAFNILYDTAHWLWDHGIGWLVRNGVGAFQELGDKASWLYTVGVKPWLDKIGDAVDFLWSGPGKLKYVIGLIKGGFVSVADTVFWVKDEVGKWLDKILEKAQEFGALFVAAFNLAKTFLGPVWDGVKGAIATPVKWVIDVVYTNGIKKVWDFVADVVKLGHLPDGPKLEGFAGGGIYPGYTPGRDIGVIGVSGGEAIMRPEWTRVAGADYVHQANAAAASGGVDGARRFVEAKGLPYLGGFDLGGIPGLDDAKEWGEGIVRGFAAKSIEALFAPIRASVNKILPDTPEVSKLVKGIPFRLMDAIVQFIKDDDAKQGGGENVSRALAWARTQAGKPYQWGGGGNPSWDCSGFMAGIEQTILGRKPGRLFTTFDFVGSSAPAGWKHNLQAPFTVGVSNLGVGHMAGTLGGVNVESRGGDGVVVGPAARGSNNPMFLDRYGFTPSIEAAFEGAQPTGALAAWIRAALAATGTPPPNSLAAWMNGMATLVGRESGGNVFAINTTDSNAAAGNPSQGLAQVIPTTFKAYHQDGTSWNILDPVANLAASINYIKSRYGDISKVQQANPNKDPRGYALGGVIPMRAYDSGGGLPPGLTLAWNGTGQTEQTYTAQQNRMLLAMAARGAASPAQGGGQAPGTALNIENWHQYDGPGARQVAEEMHAIGMARGPRK